MDVVPVKTFFEESFSRTLSRVSEDRPVSLQAALVARLRAIPNGQVSATARAAGMQLRQLMRLREGKNTDVKLSTLQRLAHALGVSPVVLLGGRDADGQPQPKAAPAVDVRAARRYVKRIRAAFVDLEKLAGLFPDEDER